MTSKTFFETLRGIVCKSGMEEKVSLSENTNELADLMVYQEEGAPEYLAMGGNPLFQFGEIKSILYQYGEEKPYSFVGTRLQLIIVLDGIALDEDVKYILEFGDNGLCDGMLLAGKWLVSREEIKDGLAAYHRMSRKRTSARSLLRAFEGATDDEDIYLDSSRSVVKAALWSYIQENPCDRDVLFDCAHTALQLYVYEDDDLLDVKAFLERVVINEYQDEFMEYIRVYEYDDDYLNRYLDDAAAALQLIREVEKQQAGETPQAAAAE